MTVHHLRPLACPLACQEVVARVAIDDRGATADLVLSLAVTEALDLIREGRIGRAEYRLARALATAQRILGQSEPGGAS